MGQKDKESSSTCAKKKKSKARLRNRQTIGNQQDRLDQLKNKINDERYISAAVSKIAGDLAQDFF